MKNFPNIAMAHKILLAALAFVLALTTIPAVRAATNYYYNQMSFTNTAFDRDRIPFYEDLDAEIDRCITRSVRQYYNPISNTNPQPTPRYYLSRSLLKNCIRHEMIEMQQRYMYPTDSSGYNYYPGSYPAYSQSSYPYSFPYFNSSRQYQSQYQSSIMQSSVTSGQAAANIVNFSYQPAVLRVKRGTTVVWTNYDNIAHTVTGDNGGPSSPMLNTGQSYSYRFDTVGTFSYHCQPHPQMKGVVEVTE